MNYLKKHYKMRIAIFTLLITVVFTQCKTQQNASQSQSPTAKYNYYTSVEKIYKLEKNMSYLKVNDILGIQPHDIYVDFNSGKKIVTYLYKNRYHEVENTLTDSEKGLNGGTPKYLTSSEDDKSLYCVFDQNTQLLNSYVTDLGRNQASEVLKDEQNLKSYVKNPSKPRKLKTKKSEGKLKLKSFGSSKIPSLGGVPKLGFNKN
jgi:hypothetical protein